MHSGSIWGISFTKTNARPFLSSLITMVTRLISIYDIRYPHSSFNIHAYYNFYAYITMGCYFVAFYSEEVECLSKS